MTCKVHCQHKHHLVPKFEGGEDTESNLVKVSDVCHTMWHWNEWLRTGKPEHKGAYHLLCGQLQGESHSARMKRLWADPEIKEWLMSCREGTIEKLLAEGHYSEMGKKGGKAAAKSEAMRKSRYRPDNQRKHCVQRSPKLEPLLFRWLTFQHKDGYKFTAKFDYTMRPITQKLSLFSGKACSPSLWTKLFTEGKTVAGWTLISVSI